VIFRLLAKRCRIVPPAAFQLTVSQASSLLDGSDPSDPHRGLTPIRGLADLERFRALCPSEEDFDV
jgi:hypothetical protein